MRNHDVDLITLGQYAAQPHCSRFRESDKPCEMTMKWVNCCCVCVCIVFPNIE